MKFLIHSLSIFLFAGQISAQCNVQTNQRDDGVTLRYLRSDRIGFSDKLMLALSMQTNGEQFFVATLSVFETTAFKLKGNLTIKFANNKSSTLEHYTSQITTFNGYPATTSIYIADTNGLQNIASPNISIVLLQLDNDVFQTVPAKMNADILKKDYNCQK